MKDIPIGGTPPRAHVDGYVCRRCGRLYVSEAAGDAALAGDVRKKP